jgi:hypothetical protein
VDQIEGFFSPSLVQRAVFPHVQLLTLEALTGRIVSSSYMPKPGHARYAAMLDAIADLFERYQENGFVRLEYECAVSYERLDTSKG